MHNGRIRANSEGKGHGTEFILELPVYLSLCPPPDTTNIENSFFNLNEGQFESKKNRDYSISEDNLTLLKQLLGITFDDLSMVKISSKQRQSFLNMILLYFELHLGNFRRPKSLQIFNQVFN